MTENMLLKGVKLFYNSNYYEATSVLSKVYKENNDTEAGYYLALCYTHIKDFDNALAVFDNILSNIDHELRKMQIHIIIAYIYTIKKMYDLAEFELKEAVKFGVENVQIYSSLGYVYYKQGKVELAMAYLQKAITLEPYNSNARNTLGFILADTKSDIERGIKEIKEALETDYDNPAYLDSLGWAYLQKKDYLNARRFLTRAFENSPDNEDIKEHIRELEKIAPSGRRGGII